MWSIHKEIEQAINDLHIGNNHLHSYDPIMAKDIQKKAMEKFVIGNPRVWWLSLKQPYKVFDYPDGNGYMFLSSYIPKEEKFWFIPETEEDNLPVYETDIDTVQAIIAECSPFEYYLVGKRLNWLLIENDHNAIIFCN